MYRGSHKTRAKNRANAPTTTGLWPIWVICGLLVGFIVLLVVKAHINQPLGTSDTSTIMIDGTRDLDLSIKNLRPNQLYLYQISDQTETTKMVVHLDATGRPHATLATCRQCYESSRSHYAHHGAMICGRCNHPMRFPEESAKLGSGNCELLTIRGETSENSFVVSVRSAIQVAASLAH